MGHRRTRGATMREIAERARQEEAVARDRASVDREREAAAGEADPYVIELGSRTYVVQDEPALTPAEAQALAVTSRLVVRDPCGCGGGCGYDTWAGARVDDVVRAGPPVVRAGELLALQDGDGAACGVLVVQDVRWGRLR